MLKFLALFLVASFSFAAELEVLSGTIESNGTIVNAHGDVVVLYEDMMIASQHMSYDKNQSTIDFKGNIHLLRGDSYYVLGDTLHLNTVEKTTAFKPLFLHEKQSYVWFSGEKSDSKNGVYNLYDAVVSSCNPIDPEWRISYTSGTYDTNEKWVDLYNIVIYGGPIPIIYLPYFGFTTDKTRTTGFLVPKIGWGRNEGFFYEQPFYIVPSNNTDIEIKFQHRAKRGNGIFTDFRFIDSETSHGEISLGYFSEDNENSQAFGWNNKEHYGIDIDYDNKHLLDHLGEGLTDELYVDIKLYNDIDYVNMQAKKNEVVNTSTILTSKINYNINGENHYFGAYAKYFFDTTSQTTTTSLQEMPKTQYHKYVDTLFTDNITYSIDYKMTNRARVDLISAYENVVSAPISYSLSLFDEYLNLSLTEDMTFSKIYFRNTEGDTRFEEGSYASISQTVSVDTDLIKKDEEGSHAIRFGASYVFPGSEYQKGFYENKYGQFDDQNCTTGELCEFVQGSIDPVSRVVNVELSQYLFDHKGSQWLYHKIKQPIYVEDNTTYGTLENELALSLWGGVNFYNALFYNQEEKNLEQASTTLSYSGGGFSGSINHLFQDKPSLNVKSDYITLGVEYQYSQFYKYNASYAYDQLTEESRNWSVGVAMTKRCWSYTFGLSENIIPTSTDSLREQYLSFSINLIPIAGFSYDYQLNDAGE